MEICANLVGETDAAAEQDPADDKHSEVLGGPVEDDADDEEDAGDEHGEAASEAAGGVGGEEGGGEAGEVERRGEELQALVVVLAVVALLVLVLPAQHRREELTQEIVHRCHSACKNKQFLDLRTGC